jgi:hypothetical protein
MAGLVRENDLQFRRLGSSSRTSFRICRLVESAKARRAASTGKSVSKSLRKNQVTFWPPHAISVRERAWPLLACDVAANQAVA